MKIAKVGRVVIHMVSGAIDIMDYEFAEDSEITPTECIKTLILEQAKKIINVAIMRELNNDGKCNKSGTLIACKDCKHNTEHDARSGQDVCHCNE